MTSSQNLCRLSQIDHEDEDFHNLWQEKTLFDQIAEIHLNISSHSEQIRGLKELTMDCLVFEANKGEGNEYISTHCKVDLFILYVFNKL